MRNTVLSGVQRKTDTHCLIDSARNLANSHAASDAQTGDAVADSLSGVHLHNDIHDTLGSASHFELGGDHNAGDTQQVAVGVSDPCSSQAKLDTQLSHAGASDLEESTVFTNTQTCIDSSADFCSGHRRLDTQTVAAAASPVVDGRNKDDAPSVESPSTQTPPTIEFPASTKEASAGVIEEPWVLNLPGEGTPEGPHLDPYLATPSLYMLADQLDDTEQSRIRAENRFRQFTRTEADKDGIIRGHGIPVDAPAAVIQKQHMEGEKELEKALVKALEKEIKLNPLSDFVMNHVPGLGLKTAARLLSAIGDPYVREDGTTRTVYQLYSYVGVGLREMEDPDTGELVWGAQKRQRGMQANWSTKARMRLHIVEEGMLKAGIRTDKESGEKRAISEYGQLYLDRRDVTEVTHPEWSKAHHHNDALRVMGKRLLKNLWREARRIHKNDAAWREWNATVSGSVRDSGTESVQNSEGEVA